MLIFLFLCLLTFLYISIRLDSSFNSLYQELVIVTKWYVKVLSFLRFLVRSYNVLFGVHIYTLWENNNQSICLKRHCEGNMPSGFETRKCSIRWKPNSSFENLWLWILQGTTYVTHIIASSVFHILYRVFVLIWHACYWGGRIIK